MEKKQRNIEITTKKLEGASINDLCREYKTSASNINRIVKDTRAKYPEELPQLEVQE